MMKLSEAIRLGAMLKPQARGELFKTTGRTCALGAALEALGIKGVKEKAKGRDTRGNLITTQTMISYSWPVEIGRTLDLTVFLPCRAKADCRTLDSVRNIISHLNDKHHWTRERIADWVATIEPPEPRIEAELSLADVLAVKETK